MIVFGALFLLSLFYVLVFLLVSIQKVQIIDVDFEDVRLVNCWQIV